jgi:DDB1- and CUL4-associated factor 13
MSSFFARSDGPRSAHLPVHSNKEKFAKRYRPWLTSYQLPNPFSARRTLRIPIPNIPLFRTLSNHRHGRYLIPLIHIFGLFALYHFLSTVFSSLGPNTPSIRPVFSRPSTLVYEKEDLRRIWKWELASGHYPSRRPSMFENTFDRKF